MTADEYNDNRYVIVIQALKLGLHVPYKHDWDLFYNNGQVYQSHINNKSGNKVVHKSAVTLTEFLNFVDSLDITRLKRLFGDTRLIQLQNKLIKDNE